MASLKTIEILLIEDSKSDVALIKRYLEESQGFEYKLNHCVRLSKGLKILKENNIDVILLDLSLPDSDKTQTLDIILREKFKIPIIILTGQTERDIALISLKKGAQDYLVKGDIDTNVLERSILYTIERYNTDLKKTERTPSLTQLDNKDEEILNILQENYKISYSELSKIVNLAASTIHNRVKNMEKTGIILPFNTLIDPMKVGYKAKAIIGIGVDPKLINDIALKISSYNEIQLVATTTGDHDIVAIIIHRDEKSLHKFIKEKIMTIEGVRTQIDVSSFLDVFKMDHKIYFKLEK